LGRNQIAPICAVHSFSLDGGDWVSVSDLQDRRRCFGLSIGSGNGDQKMREGFSISDVQDPYFALNYLLSAMTSRLVYVEG